MASVEVLIEKQQTVAMLTKIQGALQPAALGAFMHEFMVPYIQQRGADRFATEGDDVSGPWASLKEATQNIREQSGYGPEGPINQRTGELESYIVDSEALVMPNVAGVTMTYPGVEATGELGEKMQTAQSGRTSPNTVPRPVLGVNEADMAFAHTSLEQYIWEAVHL